MRLVTFNLLHGRSLADGEVDPDRFSRAVRTLAPDILGLQEVDRSQTRSHLTDFTELAATAMGAVAHRFVATVAGTPGQTWTAATGQEPTDQPAYGIALLSRYPVHEWRVLRLAPPPGRYPVFVPGLNRLVVIREEPRAVVVARVQTPAGMVTVANTHLSFVPGWNRHQYTRVLRELADAGDPVVLMGDLNRAGFPRRSTGGFVPLAVAPTFPVDRPRRQIDHILLRGDLGTARDGHAVALELSDHRALTVDCP